MRHIDDFQVKLKIWVRRKLNMKYEAHGDGSPLRSKSENVESRCRKIWNIRSGIMKTRTGVVGEGGYEHSSLAMLTPHFCLFMAQIPSLGVWRAFILMMWREAGLHLSRLQPHSWQISSLAGVSSSELV